MLYNIFDAKSCLILFTVKLQITMTNYFMFLIQTHYRSTVSNGNWLVERSYEMSHISTPRLHVSDDFVFSRTPKTRLICNPRLPVPNGVVFLTVFAAAKTRGADRAEITEWIVVVDQQFPRFARCDAFVSTGSVYSKIPKSSHLILRNEIQQRAPSVARNRI